jgi:hypothetical protein
MATKFVLPGLDPGICETRQTAATAGRWTAPVVIQDHGGSQIDETYSLSGGMIIQSHCPAP